jgi:hypothetical protein
MVAFYKRWLAQSDRSDPAKALRETRLAYTSPTEIRPWASHASGLPTSWWSRAMVRRGAALVIGGLAMAAGLPSQADECFCLMRPFQGAGAADLPVLILPWDQVSAIRVLPEYTSCK